MADTQRTKQLLDELRGYIADAPQNQQAGLVQQLFGEHLPGHYLATQAQPIADALPESSIRAWVANLKQWNRTLPKTVGGLRGFESAGVGEQDLAHYRPLAGAEMRGDAYKFGLNPNSGLADLRFKQMAGEQKGWFPEPQYPTMERADAVFNHEMGHALEQRLESFATQKVIEGDPSLSIKLRGLRQGLVEDALNGKVSGYAQNSIIRKLQDSGLLSDQEILKHGPQVEGVASHALNQIKNEGYQFGDPTLRALAQEPIAEAFAKDPGVLNEVLGHATAGGFQGMITPELAMRGAAGMAIPLIAHAALPHNELVDQAANGAGLGMAFGGLPGAAIGAGANVLAHHFLGIGL